MYESIKKEVHSIYDFNQNVDAPFIRVLDGVLTVKPHRKYRTNNN